MLQSYRNILVTSWMIWSGISRTSTHQEESHAYRNELKSLNLGTSPTPGISAQKSAFSRIFTFSSIIPDIDSHFVYHQQYLLWWSSSAWMISHSVCWSLSSQVGNCCTCMSIWINARRCWAVCKALHSPQQKRRVSSYRGKGHCPQLAFAVVTHCGYN